MKTLRILFLISLVATVPQLAAAATSTSSFLVTITITAGCAINSTTTMDFGTQSALAAEVVSQSTITVQCTPLQSYNIGLDEGTAPGATVTTRRMINGSDEVAYSLYLDPTRLLNWGETVGTDTLPFIGTGLQIPHTVYGRVPAQTTPPPGTYNDTITVTLTF